MSLELHNSTVTPSTLHASTLITSLLSATSVSFTGLMSSVKNDCSIVSPTISNIGSDSFNSNSSSTSMSISSPSKTISSNSTDPSISSSISSFIIPLDTTSFHSHPSVSSKFTESSSMPKVSTHSTSSGSSSRSTETETGTLKYTASSKVTTEITSHMRTVPYPEETTVYYTQLFYVTDLSTTITTSLPYSTVISKGQSFFSDSLQGISTDIAYLSSVVPGYKSPKTSNLNDSTSNKKTIAGSVGGSVMGCILIILVMWYFLYMRKKKTTVISDKGFSHSIESTRRYDDNHFHLSGTQISSLRLHSLLPFSRVSTSSESSNGSNDSNDLGSLRFSILKDQEIPNEKPPMMAHTPNINFKRLVPNKYTKCRTIDTVFEESDASSESSPVRHSQPQLTSPLYNNRPKPNSQRYQNSGLKPMNPFEPANIAFPPLPRRANAYPSANDFHRHGNNRHSLTSIESSLVSEDADDTSTDESLIQFGEDGMPINNNSSSNISFFKEVV